MNQEKIGAFIAQQRKINHLTQQELANQLHITDKAVSKWETGRNLPDLTLLLSISEVLQINVIELLHGEKMPPQEELKPENSMEEVITYSTKEKRRKTKQLNLLFAFGIIFVLLSVINLQLHLISEFIPNHHIEQGLTGALFGLGVGFETIAFYYNNKN